ncbi:MAG: hypothetical protein UZ19_OD1000513 [Parcubacteria bacterium OLB19]|nr:MAG: hypothetical protein UZ19_OD1000513 [Parcubacteria bacterium OLB19]
MTQVIKNSKSGFALLISMIVVGVVVSVGLSILELTIKQMALATNSKDSETALNAANAGLECAQYWRNEATGPDPDKFTYRKLESGADDITITCFGTGSDHQEELHKEVVTTSAGTGNAYKYTTNLGFDWGTIGVDERCSVITMIVMVAESDSSVPLKIDDINNHIPGYKSGEFKECEPGGICTFTSVQGYNKSCSKKGVFGTIQREVLLES